jgi:Zn-finger protein
MFKFPDEIEASPVCYCRFYGWQNTRRQRGAMKEGGVYIRNFDSCTSYYSTPILPALLHPSPSDGKPVQQWGRRREKRAELCLEEGLDQYLIRTQLESKHSLKNCHEG